MISIVIFDLDGTLIDSNEIKRKGFFDIVAGHVDGTARMGEVLKRVQGDRRAVFSAYVADASNTGNSDPQEVDVLVHAYCHRVDALVATAREMPGATLLLERLRQHQRSLYVSSATPVESLRGILKSRGWMHFFDDVFGHPTIKSETIANVLHSNRAESASLAVVGDGVDDRDSARLAGCAFFPVGEARGASREDRVYSLLELPELLLR